MNLGDDRPFLPEGTTGTVRLSPPASATKLCLTYEIVGTTDALYLQAPQGLTVHTTVCEPMRVIARLFWRGQHHVPHRGST